MKIGELLDRHPENDTMPGLLPCPFCGSDAEVKKSTFGMGGTDINFYIQCSGCEAKSKECFDYPPQQNGELLARTAWNMRK